MNKQNFINSIKGGAVEGYKRYKILPSLTIAQAILESGWGKSHIENNLFGIKAGSSWKGKVAIRETKEFINGKWITVNAKFRAYNSFNESIEDHAKLIGANKRYEKVTKASDYKTACNEIWKAGYATDPQYPQKLIQIIEQNNLDEYDKEVVGMQTLRKGSRGDQVKKLQTQLNNIGINAGNPDGIFGNNTERGVREFQGIFNLVVDGIVGSKSWEVLSKLEKVKHFKTNEFKCKHCGQVKLNVNLLLKLEELRRAIGNKPIIVTSGYRCPTHNKAVGGAKNSQHMYGTAADIRVNGMSPRDLEKYADKIFANGGVGMGGSTIVHVDTRGHRARWRYN